MLDHEAAWSFVVARKWFLGLLSYVKDVDRIRPDDANHYEEQEEVKLHYWQGLMVSCASATTEYSSPSANCSRVRVRVRV